VAVGVYWAKDLRLYGGLYAVFFAMAVAGHFAWAKSMAARRESDDLKVSDGEQGRPMLP
jgi:hypothetical protein